MRSVPWYRHILPILAVTVLSFVLSQAPLALSPRPLSLGNEGEGPFHIAVEMKLRDPALFSKDVGLNMLVVPSRPLTDRLIHRAVIYVGDAIFGGDLVVANIALFWLYHVLFIAGCYFLGLRVLRCTWGGVLFAAASTMPSQALFEGWGMVYGGGVIPHVLMLTIVPWFILGFLKSADHPCRMAVLFALLGLSANVYALVPLHLFVVLFVVAIVGKPAKWLLVWALAFRHHGVASNLRGCIAHSDPLC